MKENSDSLDLGDHVTRLEGEYGENTSGVGEGVVKALLADVGVGDLTGMEEAFSIRLW